MGFKILKLIFETYINRNIKNTQRHLSLAKKNMYLVTVVNYQWTSNLTASRLRPLFFTLPISNFISAVLLQWSISGMSAKSLTKYTSIRKIKF